MSKIALGQQNQPHQRDSAVARALRKSSSSAIVVECVSRIRRPDLTILNSGLPLEVMKNTRLNIIRLNSALVGATLALASPAFAKPPGHAKGGKKGNNGKSKIHKNIDKDKNRSNGAKEKARGQNDKARGHRGNEAKNRKFDDFDARHIGIFQEYFRPYRNTRGLPPGIAKQVRAGKGLPPGWEKNFVRGQRIEDQVWNQLIPLPNDLAQRIQHQRPGRYYILNDRLVRVNPDNRTLLGAILLNELLD